MLFNSKLVLLGYCVIAGCQFSHGAMPLPEVIGQLFGYPSSELIVEDTTSKEQTLIQTPSRREQKKNTELPTPTDVLRAYLIHGTKKNSFFPIHVYIGKQGTFLTPEVMSRLAELDAIPIEKRAGLGTQGVAGIGRGGFYFSDDLKIESVVPPITSPSLVAALIAVVQPHGQAFDVKIAQRAALVNQGEELELIPGVERYFNTFGPSADQKSEPRLDVAKVFPELTKVVIAEWLAETGATAPPPTPPTEKPQTVPSERIAPAAPRSDQTPVADGSTLPSKPAPPPRAVGVDSSPSVWPWVVGIFALFLIAWIFLKLRSKK